MAVILTQGKKVRVLIVDDSALIRKMLVDELSKEDWIEIVGTAPDPIIARNKIVMLEPEVLLLDDELPRMNGITFLEKLMKYYPMPVILLSSQGYKGSETFQRAMDAGAADVFPKPESAYDIVKLIGLLTDKIKVVSGNKDMIKDHPADKKIGSRDTLKALLPDKKIGSKDTLKSPLSEKKIGSRDTFETRLSDKKIKTEQGNEIYRVPNKIIAIGASTGGTEAIKELLIRLPEKMPPILIVQHMPQNFTSPFAKRLDSLCKLKVKEAEDEEPAKPGTVLIAPGNKHMVLRKNGASYYVRVQEGPMVFHQRPSVEVLFQSVADFSGSNAIGVILTGMGRDGASGLLKMREAGAYTIAQDEKSCVVFGMPGEAIKLQAAVKVAPLQEIPQIIVENMGQ